jgi:glycosyltransferase involved in cell wall biosynthesis
LSERFPLSVVILARNEAANIRRCVEAVNWCRDVVVVDDGSTDATAAIAIDAGALVVSHPFTSFAAQRNWAVAEAGLQCDWVLMLDADEVVTPELREELIHALTDVAADIVAFRLCRKTMLFDRWLKRSDDFPVWIMRLVRRGRVWFEDRGHGEVAIPQVDGRMEAIRAPMEHYVFSKGLADWIARHNRYSTNEALLEWQAGRAVSWRQLFSGDRAVRRAGLRSLSRVMPFRPQLRFLYQYVLKGGFLDGWPGYVFCSLLATYERWIVLKRRELDQNVGNECTHEQQSLKAEPPPRSTGDAQSPVARISR